MTLQRTVDRQIIADLERASKDAEARIRALVGRDNISARVERAQLSQARSEIQRILATLYTAIGETTRAGQAQAAALATQLGWEWDQILFTRVGMTAAERAAMRTSLEQTASRNVEAAIARITRGRVPLSARVYRSRELSTGLIEARINSALARGLNVKQFAAEVRNSIRPDTPGGVAYAAKRLARTEINAAYHAVTVEQQREKPWNTGMSWNLSRSHPETDICDLYADRSPYEPSAVPPKPHPQCLCYTAPETVTPEEFVQNWRAGRYESYISQNYGRMTNRVA